jgi:hypothetical protein
MKKQRDVIRQSKKRNGNNRERKKVGITLPQVMVARIRAIAARDKRDISSTIEIALDGFLATDTRLHAVIGGVGA